MIPTEDILALGFTLRRESGKGRSFCSMDEQYMLTVGNHEDYHILMWFESRPPQPGFQRADPQYYKTHITGHKSKVYEQVDARSVDEVLSYLVLRKFQPAIILTRNKKIDIILE